MKRRQTFSVRSAGPGEERVLRRVVALREAGLFDEGSLNTVAVLHVDSCPKAHRAEAKCRCSPSLYVNGRLVEAGEA